MAERLVQTLFVPLDSQLDSTIPSKTGTTISLGLELAYAPADLPCALCLGVHNPSLFIKFPALVVQKPTLVLQGGDYYHSILVHPSRASSISSTRSERRRVASGIPS